MVSIAYFTELNLQICDYAQKRRICCKNCKYAFDENFNDHFCPRRKAAKFCHPGHGHDGSHLHSPAGEDDEDDRGVADHGGQGDRAVEQRDHNHLAQLRNDNCTSSLEWSQRSGSLTFSGEIS